MEGTAAIAGCLPHREECKVHEHTHEGGPLEPEQRVPGPQLEAHTDVHGVHVDVAGQHLNHARQLGTHQQDDLRNGRRKLCSASV